MNPEDQTLMTVNEDTIDVALIKQLPEEIWKIIININYEEFENYVRKIISENIEIKYEKFCEKRLIKLIISYYYEMNTQLLDKLLEYHTSYQLISYIQHNDDYIIHEIEQYEMMIDFDIDYLHIPHQFLESIIDYLDR